METITIKINSNEYPVPVTMGEAISRCRDIAINQRRTAILYARSNGKWVHLGTYNPNLDGFITYTEPHTRKTTRIPCCDAQPHPIRKPVNIYQE